MSTTPVCDVRVVEQKLMKVSIEVNGEFITTEVPTDHIVWAKFEDGHLRGIQTTESLDEDKLDQD